MKKWRKKIAEYSEKRRSGESVKCGEGTDANKELTKKKDRQS